MANEEHLRILRQGARIWNKWKWDNFSTEPDFSECALPNIDLANADLRQANFKRADLRHSYLIEANFSSTNLSEANLECSRLSRTQLFEATFRSANMRRVSLRFADLTRGDFAGADLSDGNLQYTRIVEANMNGAKLKSCRVYGASVWNSNFAGADQTDLVINHPLEPTITADNIEVAQFIYLLLNNEKIRSVIDTITSKVVLILGRFTTDRKSILDAIREELRRRDYVPVLFDFEKPSNRDITETVSILAHMARFVIADITDAKSIPQELTTIVRDLPSVPVQPLLLASQQEYGMFEHFRRFPWVLKPYLYEDEEGLLAALPDKVIAPAEAMAKVQTKPNR